MHLSLILLILVVAFITQPVVTAENGKPHFTTEPADSKSVITKSTILKCKVENALNAWFECSEDESTIDRKETQSEYVEPRNGVRHIELTVDIKRRVTDRFAGPIQTVMCWCGAYGGHQTILSHKAILEFSTVPYFEPEETVVSKAIDGGWNSWTQWSTCSHECQQVRRRSCTNPSPKYGGQHCSGGDIHLRNCTGGMCRKLDIYHQKREKEDSSSLGSSAKSGRGGSDRDIYLLAVVSTTTLLFFFVVFLLIIVKRRRYKNESGFIDMTTTEDGHAIHLLMQQQQQRGLTPGMQIQPDLLLSDRSTGGSNGSSGGDKMQLISRLNNFDSNALEHLVIRNEHLSLEKGSPNHMMTNNLTHNNMGQNNNHILTNGSNGSSGGTPHHRSSNQGTPHHIQQQHHYHQSRSHTESDSDLEGVEDLDHNEPDYAEPILTSPLTYTPERRPPALPRCNPPGIQRDTYVSPRMQVQHGAPLPPPHSQHHVQNQHHKSPPSSGSEVGRKKGRTSTRPTTRTPRYKNMESSSSSSSSHS